MKGKRVGVIKKGIGWGWERWEAERTVGEQKEETMETRRRE